MTPWGGRFLAVGLAGMFFFAGCAGGKSSLQAVNSNPALLEVARSERQWTGVAVSREGRIFVTFPRWSDGVTFSVGEVTGPEKVKPFPNEKWNRWDPSLPAGEHFVCVQSVYIDDHDRLWILDPANPKFQGVVPGGPKLVQVDLKSNRVVRTISFDAAAAFPDSYLNDVRIDTEKEIAYLTDSGTGALVVVDLATGKSRRLLADNPSTKSEGIILVINGKLWLQQGLPPQVHADGVALDPKRRYLYYQALTGRTLCRIETRYLLDRSLSARELGGKVESLGRTGAADGIMFGPDGNLYLTALEYNAIRRYTPGEKVEMVIQDPRLQWPDSLAITADGFLYLTTSQIHFGDNPPGPYRIFRMKLKD